MSAIFISHTAEDQEVAGELATGLEEAGYHPWSYEHQSLPGSSYLDQILEAIEHAQAMLVLVSPHALSSFQMDREIVQAYERDRPLLPLLKELSYQEFRERKRSWAMMVGATVSLEIPPEGVTRILPQVIAGLARMGVMPEAHQEEASRPLPAPVPDSRARTELRTFLIADIRGYSTFADEQGDAAGARLAGRFAALTKELVAARDGEVVELRGDEALATFGSARDALRAAVDLQQRFAREAEADPSLPLRVGIGLDIGEAIPVEGGYRGGAVNLAARLCSLAAPGEIFASEGVIHTARKMEGFAYLERGEVQLTGFAHPLRVIQVVPEGDVPAAVPKFTVHVTQSSHLPAQPTPFIGREKELTTVTGGIVRDDIRLLTLTGPGGMGKTRLAVQAANDVQPTFADGVFFVSLAPISDPDLVLSAIASTLEVKEASPQALIETLKEYLREKQMLLVLDNFEHVLAACSQVGELLSSCPRLKVMVTSRAVLHLAAEHVYSLPPLSVPDPMHLPDLDTLSQYDAVALFIERAQAARGHFTVTNENAPAVAEICSRLDGLPLAIELAAARIRLFPPRALLSRLASRLKLLTGGARDRPARQQTLRGAIEWSYSLLSREEQTLFTRLSVFAGGCTLEAAEAVCNAEGDLEMDTLDGIASLVEKSLLRQEGEEEPRFLMLETIREYALERLEAAGDADAVRDRHAHHYLTLTEDALALRYTDGPAAMRRLAAEHDNLRAALRWFLGQADPESALQFAGHLGWFWFMGGDLTEGRRWLNEALAQGRALRTRGRLAAVIWSGQLAWGQGDHERSIPLAEESIALCRELGETRMLGATLKDLGNMLAQHRGQYDRAEALFEESMEVDRAAGGTGAAARLGLASVARKV